ncbi:cytochrome C [Rhodoferax sp.]|uniref:cytochrome C n=1 Tax=Rhodoferax sp. TaxID=50421 RepID=UPI00263177CE|nr:cytochrome C [Rhodoferax sp.]MDD5480123.1 cytochrome C [Rhodoferax sp.]
MPRLSHLLKTSLVLLLTAGSMHAAWADDDEGGGRWWGGSWGGGSRGGMVSNAPPQYKTECASCHMAYPAGLLPAGSWQNMMANLSKHFGNDASIDAASASAISQYLTSNAGTYKRVSEMPPENRITESYWFQRKHGKHVNNSTWARPSIGSPSNCVACHQGAENGDFNEHSVRIPN